MKHSWLALACSLCFGGLLYHTNAQELSICPLDAEQYPPPVRLASEAIFQSAVDDIASGLQQNTTDFPYNETSFYIGVFSTTDDDLAWEYHHASPLLANSSQGATGVDADSVYRIASTSKLTTVYLFLICAGEEHWTDPITKWVPELLDGTSLTEEALVPDWDSITIGDLAGQIAGLARDYGLTDYALDENVLAPAPLRDLLPPAPESGVPACGYVTPRLDFMPCTAERKDATPAATADLKLHWPTANFSAEYINGAGSQPPVFTPAYTPSYSNQAYIIISVALERITGRPFEDIFDKHLVQALNLTSTFYSKPPPLDEHALVPFSPQYAFWNADLGAYSPAGGSFSSTRDFAKLGKAILQSKLLSLEVTRRWLKPTSFAGGLNQAVGRPWEIIRMSLDDGSVVDVYTKAGDLGAYDTIVALVPSFEMGFTLFTAADPNGLAGATVRNSLPNLLAEKLVGAANAVAGSPAVHKFAGKYTDKSMNSSVTFSAPSGNLPGLTLTAWINNGSDIYDRFFVQRAASVDIRILPNHLYDGQAGKVGFTSKTAVPMPSRPFYGPCDGWINVEDFMFAGIAAGQFVLDVDGEKAVSVRNLGLRASMIREGQ